MSNWFDLLAPLPIILSSDRTRLIPMSRHRILQVTGPEAAKFLQGQVTCDLRRLEQHEHLLGAHCNAKGRMISSFIVVGCGENNLGLRLRANIADKALAALRKYIVFSKARVDTTALIPLSVVGPLDSLPFTDLPPPGRSLVQGDLLLLRHTEEHLEVWVPEARIESVWQQLVVHCTPASYHALERLWVECGLADIEAATSEEFVPQMLNYHLIDGVSFKKGCYTGQEIVARMQYRGQLKKHTYLIGCDRPVDLDVGTTLGTQADMEQSAATLVASAQGAEDWRGLVVCNGEIQATTTALTEKKTGAEFTWLPLPYAIPNQ